MARDLKSSTTVALDDTTPGELYAKTKPNIAQVSITHPVAPAGQIVVVGTGDPDLNPALYASSFVPVENEYTQAVLQGAAMTVLADGRVQVNTPGTVLVQGYADISHSNNNATVGIVFRIERSGVFVLSPRTVHARMPNAGDIGNLSGVGAVDAQAGDLIGVAVAADVAGTVSFRASSLVYDFKG